jgi:hypothetical protein
MVLVSTETFLFLSIITKKDQTIFFNQSDVLRTGVQTENFQIWSFSLPFSLGPLSRGLEY